MPGHHSVCSPPPRAEVLGRGLRQGAGSGPRMSVALCPLRRNSCSVRAPAIDELHPAARTRRPLDLESTAELARKPAHQPESRGAPPSLAESESKDVILDGTLQA